MLVRQHLVTGSVLRQGFNLSEVYVVHVQCLWYVCVRDGNRTELGPLFLEEPNPNPVFTNLRRSQTEPNPSNEDTFLSLELPLCFINIYLFP